MLERKGSKIAIVLAACACAVLVIIASLAAFKPSDDPVDPFPEIGYQLGSRVLLETFTSLPYQVDIKANNTGVLYSQSDDGLRLTFNQPASSLSIESSSTSANAVRLVVDVSSIDGDHLLDVKAFFKVKSAPSLYYSVTVSISPHMIVLVPRAGLGPGTPAVQNYGFAYDAQERGTLDLVVEVIDGNMVVGIDGFSTTLQTNFKVYNDLQLGGVSVSSNQLKWSSPAQVVLKRFELGSGAASVYHDRLHTTITPWGYDFTMALQIHGDQANPAQLALLKELADNYDVRGEFDAWVDLPDDLVATAYSIDTDANYSRSLLDLQTSGWDIGLHSVIPASANRTELLTLIDRFEQTFGPLKAWVDHGSLPQDIYQYGNNATSDYYISDWLVDHNVTIWVNEENHSHSPTQDLNLVGVRYHNGSYPGLDLLRVSQYGFLFEANGWQAAYAPVTQDELSDRQRIYASNSAVLIWHDYTGKYTYVEDGGINYSMQTLPSMGYPYESITDPYNANTHPNGTWHLLPVLEAYFAAMHQDYDVWYATPREVYERSIAVEQITVSENATAVTIANSATTSLAGLTLFTKEAPRYCLRSGDIYYYSQHGAEGFHFVIPDVPAGTRMVLEKVDLPSFAPVVQKGSVSLWGGPDELFLRANEDGDVTLTSHIVGGNNMVIEDLNDNTEVSYTDSTPLAVNEGHIYRIWAR
jgi:hypothetical protein